MGEQYYKLLTGVNATQVAVHPETPETVREMIWSFVDESFQDIDALLQSPIPTHGKSPQFHFTIANTLLSIIGGVSRILYDPDEAMKDRSRFVGALLKGYPWAEEPDSCPTPRIAADILYRGFRNPIVHALGISDKAKDGKVVRLFRMGQWDFEDLKQLAPHDFHRPVGWPPTLEFDDRTIDIHLDCLYLGVRKLIYNLTCDKEKMRQTDHLLTKLVRPGGVDILADFYVLSPDTSYNPHPVMIWRKHTGTWPWKSK